MPGPIPPAGGDRLPGASGCTPGWRRPEHHPLPGRPAAPRHPTHRMPGVEPGAWGGRTTGQYHTG